MRSVVRTVCQETDGQLGNNWAIVLYTAVCIAMLIINWTVPSVIANGVAISIAGFCIGSIYPISSADFYRLIARC